MTTASSGAPTTAAVATVPRLAAVLGYAGLLPFVALAAAVWLCPVVYRTQLAFALLAYGASIASFLGAIHWGLSMRGAKPLQASGALMWGVFPSLVAWVAMLLPLAQGLWTVALLLGVCMAVDWRSYPAYGLGAWRTMRLHLTGVAMVGLWAGGAGV